MDLEIANAVRELPEEIDFPAVLELITGKHTSHIKDRHVKAILKVCKQCQNGFLLKHLPYLSEMVDILGKNLKAPGQNDKSGGVWQAGEFVSEEEWEHHLWLFAPCVCEVAKVASLPFVSTQAEDLLNYGKFLPVFMNNVISILSSVLPNNATGGLTPESHRSKKNSIAEDAGAAGGDGGLPGLPEGGVEDENGNFVPVKFNPKKGQEVEESDEVRRLKEMIRIEIAYMIASVARYGLELSEKLTTFGDASLSSYYHIHFDDFDYLHVHFHRKNAIILIDLFEAPTRWIVRVRRTIFLHFLLSSLLGDGDITNEENPAEDALKHDSLIQNVAKTGTPSLRLLQQTSVIDELAQAFR